MVCLRKMASSAAAMKSATERITTGYGYDAAGSITRATDGNRCAAR
ncbi:hypothetical protein ACWEV3_19610 [Saccharopolyspora sp. NPDC003752]